MIDLMLLNLKADRFCSGNLLDKYKPHDGYLDDNVQVIPKTENAFTLTLSEINIKTVTSSVTIPDGVSAIIRVPISYTSLLKMQNDTQLFDYSMYNIINKALIALTRRVGNLQDRYVTCERPGMPGHYFTENENLAGAEVRFFLRRNEINEF